MDNPAVGSYHYEKWCINCQRTTVFLVTISKRSDDTQVYHWSIITTTCQKCKIGEGKAI